MLANLALAAGLALGEPSDSVVALPGTLPFRRIGPSLNEMRQQRDIAVLPK